MEGDLIFSVCFSKYALLFRSVFVCLLWEHPLFCNHIHYYSVHQAYDSFFGTLLLRTSFHIVLIFVPKVHGDLRIVGPWKHLFWAIAFLFVILFIPLLTDTLQRDAKATEASRHRSH